MMTDVSAVLSARGMRLAIRLGLAFLVLIVVAAGFSCVVYRSAYNVWPGQGASTRVYWCGRTYENSSGATLSWSDVNQPFPVRLVGQYPPLAYLQGIQPVGRAINRLELRIAERPP